MRQFLDRLPLVFQAKGSPARGIDDRAERDHITKLVEATLHHRRAAMKYFSLSSQREKDYVVEPYRLVFSQGGLYLMAYVPEYSAFRTFAVERVRGISLHEERFTPIDLPEETFAHSLGINQGTPERIEIAFDAQIAPYIRERRWHTSQQIKGAPDGGIVVVLDVTNDWALRSWILSFGPLAKVLSPPALASQIKDEVARAAARYALE
jgi:predicted DNA-binding transcriptional regulator YafY